ncbi:hypothetical protein KR032_009699 [Drosophila birchii]|nr:hypothetical protein KR032_009699 [Drosophila birchii]
MFMKLSLNDSNTDEPMSKDITETDVLENIHNDNPNQDSLEAMVISESIEIGISLPQDLNINPEQDVLMVTVNGSLEQPAEVIKDGNYFLQMLRDEQKRLLAMADTADQYAAGLVDRTNRGEYALEKLRLVSGSARLLASSKMQQFEGLCLKNLNPLADNQFSVTIDDLHGFWDMVYQQVPPLDAQFAEILQLKENNWQATVAGGSGGSGRKARGRMWRNF